MVLNPFHRGFTADLDGMIFAYNCCVPLADVMSATRIVHVSKLDVHLHDSYTQHKKMFQTPTTRRNYNQNVRMTSCLRSLLDTSSVRSKCRIRQSSEKSNRLNRR